MPGGTFEFYNSGKLRFGALDWVNDDIRIIALDSTHLKDLSNQFLSDVDADDAGTGTIQLQNKTVTLDTDTAVLDADNIDVVATVNNAQYYALVLWTGDRLTSPLLAIMDNLEEAFSYNGSFKINFDAGGLIRI